MNGIPTATVSRPIEHSSVAVMLRIYTPSVHEMDQWQGDFDRVERARLKRHHQHFGGNSATNAQVIDILRDKLALQLHPPSEMLLSRASCDSDLALELRPSVLGRVGL